MLGENLVHESRLSSPWRTANVQERAASDFSELMREEGEDLGAF
jgi:hypothetical protein